MGYYRLTNEEEDALLEVLTSVKTRERGLEALEKALLDRKRKRPIPLFMRPKGVFYCPVPADARFSEELLARVKGEVMRALRWSKVSRLNASVNYVWRHLEFAVPRLYVRYALYRMVQDKVIVAEKVGGRWAFQIRENEVQ